MRDEIVAADRGDDSRFRRTDDVGIGRFRIHALAVDLVEELTRVCADELDEGGHAERSTDVVDVEHEDDDADDDE